MCGEHSFNIHQFAGEQGSSPHVRGARSGGSSVSLLMGIIPACAGSTKGAFGIQGRHWDHPRMCGEHALNEMKIPREVGSSPHVRGARGSCVVPERVGGIIPACAGSTRKSRASLVVPRDHPRMCGEHRVGLECVFLEEGSSPHVRGALLHLRVDARDRGIIPACAGSTHHESDGADDERDHPRMCGEHFQTKRARIRLSGSSPHVRGAPHLMAELRGQSGIIPACAGSTALISINSPVSRDHPRMCGEHAVAVRVFPYSWGSSPHVRGAPKGRSGSKDGTGIIPACAGSTP